MSLVKQKSLNFELQSESSMTTSNQLYAKYDKDTNTITLDCSEGNVWYLNNETIQQITSCFNVKITNTYKNINKSIKLIFCNCNYFGNKINISDKNQNYLFGDMENFKFPFFMNGVPHLNNQNNKYIEQSFHIDNIDNNYLCITTIKNAY